MVPAGAPFLDRPAAGAGLVLGVDLFPRPSPQVGTACYQSDEDLSRTPHYDGNISDKLTSVRSATV